MYILRHNVKEKVQITTLNYDQSPNNPLNYIIWYNLPLDGISLFCFSTHKWNLKLVFYRMIEDIIMYFRKIYHHFFIIL